MYNFNNDLSKELLNSKKLQTFLNAKDDEIVVYNKYIELDDSACIQLKHQRLIFEQCKIVVKGNEVKHAFESDVNTQLEFLDCWFEFDENCKFLAHGTFKDITIKNSLVRFYGEIPLFSDNIYKMINCVFEKLDLDDGDCDYFLNRALVSGNLTQFNKKEKTRIYCKSLCSINLETEGKIEIYADKVKFCNIKSEKKIEIYADEIEDNHFYSNKSISIRNNTQGFFSEVKDNFFYCKKLISKYSDFENNFIREKDENI